jgi:hypothetical protein
LQIVTAEEIIAHEPQNIHNVYFVVLPKKYQVTDILPISGQYSFYQAGFRIHLGLQQLLIAA